MFQNSKQICFYKNKNKIWVSQDKTNVNHWGKRRVKRIGLPWLLVSPMPFFSQWYAPKHCRNDEGERYQWSSSLRPLSLVSSTTIIRFELQLSTISQLLKPIIINNQVWDVTIDKLSLFYYITKRKVYT